MIRTEFRTVSPAHGGHFSSKGSLTRKLLLALGCFVVFVLISALGYWFLEEPYSYFDGVYMTIITVATVGYGEVHPLGPAGKVWSIGVILTGAAIAALVVSLFVALVLEGEIRRILGRRHVEKEIAQMRGHLILCGYGKMGGIVAEELRERGRSIVVVDTSPERTTAAERAGLLHVLGDAQEESTLQAAGIEHAAVLVACLQDDADNVFLTLTARQANPALKIIVRAQQASTEQILRRAGATRVVCPQIIGASRVVDVITRPAVVDLVEMAHKGVELEMDQLVLTSGSSLTGKTLLELELPRKTGAVVGAVQRADGTPIYQPTSDMVLKAGDTLVLVGKKGAAKEVQQLQPGG